MARSPLLALVAGLLLAPGGEAQQPSPAQVAYVEGVRAFDAGDYATAAERMRTAVAGDAREATARFRDRAQNAEDYFPHLWLGLSLEKLGERDRALAALRESQRQGAVEARPALRRILAAALARLAPPTPVPPPVPTPAPTATPATHPAGVDATAPAAGATPPVPPAGPGPLRATARPAQETVPTVAAPAGSDAAVLRSGVRAYFRGDYGRAEGLLGPLAGRRPVARLFLAFSLGGRFLLGATRDEELLSRARSEYSTALLAGAVHAGPWVSPAILALFGAEAGTGAPAPATPPPPSRGGR